MCKEEKKEQLQIAILKYTTTIGLRAYEVERVCMERYFETVVVRDCEVPVKVVTFQDVKKSMPEYENCKKLAMQLGISIQEVYNEVMVAIYNKKSGEEEEDERYDKRFNPDRYFNGHGPYFTNYIPYF